MPAEAASMAFSDYLWIVAGMLFIVCYFAYGPYSRNRRQVLESKPPQILTRILGELGDDWTLVSFSWYGDSWKAVIGFGGRRFKLFNDDGYPFSASEVVDGMEKRLPCQWPYKNIV